MTERSFTSPNNPEQFLRDMLTLQEGPEGHRVAGWEIPDRRMTEADSRKRLAMVVATATELLEQSGTLPLDLAQLRALRGIIFDLVNIRGMELHDEAAKRGEVVLPTGPEMQAQDEEYARRVAFLMRVDQLVQAAKRDALGQAGSAEPPEDH